MFEDFGQQREDVVVVNVGGISRQRAKFARHWQSDSDLRRWQQNLDKISRNDRLLEEIRERAHPDHAMTMSTLSLRHNGFFRQRDSRKARPAHGTQVLRELQTAFTQQKAAKTSSGGELHALLEQFAQSLDG